MGGWVGGGAEVSESFYKESRSKKKIFFSWVGGGVVFFSAIGGGGLE